VISGSYENHYMEDEKLKSSEQIKDHIVTMQPLNPELICNQEAQKVQKKAKLSNSSTGQDLDVYLLGEGNSDDEPGTPYYFYLLKIVIFFLKNFVYEFGISPFINDINTFNVPE